MISSLYYLTLITLYSLCCIHYTAFISLHLLHCIYNKGKDGVELWTIEICFSGFNLRCICGYGPQESDSVENKENFCTQLGSEVEEVFSSDCGLVIEMDGNLWAGEEIIPGDPNYQNNNGKMFQKFLEKYSGLSVVNSMNICEGLITRSRSTVNRDEKSVIDFFIVCRRMKQFIEQMIIDEEKDFALTHYFKKKDIQYKKHSDHNTLIMDMKIPMCKTKKLRPENFNFRNIECQKLFHEATNQSIKLTECFNSDNSLPDQCNKWFKELNSLFHQSFKKVRVNGKIKETDFSKLMKKKNELKQQSKLAGDELNFENLKNYLSWKVN